jgi:hypothetical protein
MVTITNETGLDKAWDYLKTQDVINDECLLEDENLFFTLLYNEIEVKNKYKFINIIKLEDNGDKFNIYAITKSKVNLIENIDMIIYKNTLNNVKEIDKTLDIIIEKFEFNTQFIDSLCKARIDTRRLDRVENLISDYVESIYGISIYSELVTKLNSIYKSLLISDKSFQRPFVYTYYGILSITNRFTKLDYLTLKNIITSVEEVEFSLRREMKHNSRPNIKY